MKTKKQIESRVREGQWGRQMASDYFRAPSVEPDAPEYEEARKKFAALWAQKRWKRPPNDGRPTIHVSGAPFSHAFAPTQAASVGHVCSMQCLFLM